MATQRIVIRMDFPYPVKDLFAFFAAHENQTRVIGARVVRLGDGDGHRDGVGSARRMTMPPLPSWDETVTAFELDRRIEYRITRGGPLRGHHGTMLFHEADGGAASSLDYTITFEGGRVPFTGALLRVLTERSLRRGLEGIRAAGLSPA